MYDWTFSFILPYSAPILHGAWVTVWISLASILIGTILGVVLVASRRSSVFAVRATATAMIELLLAIPVLVLLVWTYYCIPILTGIRLSGETTAILVFSISLGAFVAETMQSGLNAIPQGQVEAAITLQLSRIQIFRYVVFPQAFRLMMPAILTQYVTLLKLSSLASVIAVYELLHTANNIVSVTYRPLEVYTIIAVVFSAIIIPFNFAIRRLNRLFDTGDKSR